MEREKFASRLGFVLISAGCAIGLGNVWRFPYIVGQYGGAAFVLIYLFFLIIMGIPIMTMEFSVGRASQASVAKSFHVLAPKSKLRGFSYAAAAGSYLLMMFYTMICGWLLYYLYKMITGTFVGMTPDEVGGVFGGLLENPGILTLNMAIITIGCFIVVGIGLKNGVEKATKFMMLSLLTLIVIMAIKCMTLPGAGEGLKFYLVPNFENLFKNGLWTTIYAAMGQAFFTLSIGIGSMAIFGSYLSKEKRLGGEAVTVTALDLFAAFMAGLVIFPACAAFGVEAGAGPSLIFITLPNIFNAMLGGVIWGSLFFIFLLFAGITTVIAVFENINAMCQDWFGWTRQKSSVINCILILLLSMPCILGFNLWAGFQPLGEGTNVLDLEDFILSNNLLPLGSLVYVLFCSSRYGWGWDKFIAEANTGTSGLGMPQHKWLRFYLTYILPCVILVIFVFGYIDKF